MDAKLSTIAAGQGGVILRKQALQAGLSDLEVKQRIRTGEWTAIRRGAYVESAVWNAADELTQHKARVHAVILGLKGPLAISHLSACVMLDVPLWNPRLSSVHVTRPPGVSTRQEAGVWHHSARLPDDQVTQASGLPLTVPSRTVIDTACVTGFEASVIVADGFLRNGLVTPEELLDMLESMRDCPGSRNAGRVVEFADGKSESVGESRARVLLDAAGLPRPELQVTVETGDRADFLIRQYRTIIEFDGKQKYGRLLGPNDDPSEVVWREKRREDRLREAGYEVVRIIWSELTNVIVIARRVRRAFARAERRHGSRLAV
jgi:very-short-patch-repair endonuclease